MTRVNALVSLLAALALSGCATTSYVSSWKAPDARPLQMAGKKVAAVVMIDDQANRRAAEAALARELTARGAVGVPMYEILPDATAKNEPAARAALEQAGVAGVVVMRPVRTDKEITATPVYGGPMYGGYWGGYYGYGWGSAYGATEIRTDTIVTVETLVYSLEQNKLVWAGQSKTTDPTHVDSFVGELASATVNELKKQGLIP